MGIWQNTKWDPGSEPPNETPAQRHETVKWKKSHFESRNIYRCKKGHVSVDRHWNTTEVPGKQQAETRRLLQILLLHCLLHQLLSSTVEWEMLNMLKGLTPEILLMPLCLLFYFHMRRCYHTISISDRVLLFEFIQLLLNF